LLTDLLHGMKTESVIDKERGNRPERFDQLALLLTR
jgi:hypothetical protein